MPKLIPIGPVDGQNNLALRSHRVTRAAKSRMNSPTRCSARNLEGLL